MRHFNRKEWNRIPLLYFYISLALLANVWDPLNGKKECLQNLGCSVDTHYIGVAVPAYEWMWNTSSVLDNSRTRARPSSDLSHKNVMPSSFIQWDTCVTFDHHYLMNSSAVDSDVFLPPWPWLLKPDPTECPEGVFNIGGVVRLQTCCLWQHQKSEVISVWQSWAMKRNASGQSSQGSDGRSLSDLRRNWAAPWGDLASLS